MENKNTQDGSSADVVIENDVIAKKDEEIAKIKTDLENYRRVALKRLGKLPGDADFVENVDKATGLTVQEAIREALLDGEYARLTKERDNEVGNLKKKVSELTLALKNRPENSVAGDGGNASTVDVKDGVLTDVQIEELKRRAKMLNLDPEKYIENVKKNLSANKK